MPKPGKTALSSAGDMPKEKEVRLLVHPGWMFVSVAAAWLLIDVAVKRIVVTTMELDQSIALWPGVFHLTYVRNTGAAFSLLKGQYWVFYTAMGLLIALVAAFWRIYKPRRWLPVLGTAFVCSGALGNLVDRLTAGSVVDLFDLRLINFAVFNVADLGITAGCILFCVWLVFQTEHSEPADGGTQTTGDSETAGTPSERPLAESDEDLALKTSGGSEA